MNGLSLWHWALVTGGEEPEVALPEGVIHQQAVYSRQGGQPLTVDLFTPAHRAGRPRPAMLWFHGGGWRSGSPSQFHPQCAALAGRGVVSASASYRLVPAGSFPRAVEDAKTAMQWLRAHAQRLNVDPARIGVGGGSAGGHLAAMVAYADAYQAETGPHREVFAGAACYVGYNPPLDLVELAAGGRATDHLAEFIGGPLAEKSDFYFAASPINHVSAAGPPALLLHGDADELVPISQSQAMAGRLAELGVEAELFTAEGAGHGFFNQEPWLSRTNEATLAFVSDRLEAG